MTRAPGVAVVTLLLHAAPAGTDGVLSSGLLALVAVPAGIVALTGAGGAERHDRPQR